MKVWLYYTDEDNSCSDPECCGGPSPMPHVKAFSSVVEAKLRGISEDALTEVEVDTNELVSLI